MFSHCYQSGNSIELYNGHDKNLFSKWKFSGRHSKVYDAQLKNYMNILDIGSLSKMELPKTTRGIRKSLGLFQSYIVFQIYVFTPKHFSIEISISDTTKTKRRLIFSSNSKDLVFNQLHCRIPIINFPVGKWVNFSIDILSFVAECFKDLTFRSIDYISLSMSGKVRKIFTMRMPLNTKEQGIPDPYTQNVPEKFQLPKCDLKAININLNCNRVVSQICIENQLQQQQQNLLNDNTYGYERKYSYYKGENYITNRNNNISRIASVGNMIITGNNSMNNNENIGNLSNFVNQNQNKGYRFFNKEEYNINYNNKLSVIGEVRKSIEFEKKISENSPIKKDIDNKWEQSNRIDYIPPYQNTQDNNLHGIGNQLSTIKNEKDDEGSDFEIHEKDLLANQISDNNKENDDDFDLEIQNMIDKEEKQRPYSPPIVQE